MDQQGEAQGSPGRQRFSGLARHLETVAVLLFYVCVTIVRHVRGHFDPAALVLLSVILPVYLLVLLGPRRGAAATPLHLGVCGVLVTLTLADLFVRDPVRYAVNQSRTIALLAAALAGCLCVAAWWAKREVLRRVFVLLAVAAFTTFLSAELLRSPHPLIDVHPICTEATSALLDGKNPYSLVYTDVYAPAGWEGYGYQMRFIYLPGMLLEYALPSALGVDFRWANLAGMAGGFLLFAWLIANRGGATRLDRQVVTAGAMSLIFWLHGGQAFSLEQGWAEPILLLCVCVALWWWHRSAWIAGIALVLALSAKQTAWFCMPFLSVLAARERRWRMPAAVAVGVGAIVLPFFLWSPGAFIDNVVLDLLAKAPRADSLSWAAVCIRVAPELFGLVAAVGPILYAVALVCLWRRLRKADRAERTLETAKWMAFGLAGLFLFLKQSFFNYYYLVWGLLAFHALLSARCEAAAPPLVGPPFAGPHARQNPATHSSARCC